MKFKDAVKIAIGEQCKHQWLQIHKDVQSDKIVLVDQCKTCRALKKETVQL